MSQAGARLTVSIVTYNHAGVIEKTLSSLVDHSRQLMPRIIIVDNGSSDGTPDNIRRDYPSTSGAGVEVMEGTNVGFGAGHNRAIAVSKSEYHLIFNPDISIGADTLPYLIEYLDQHQDVAAVTPLVKNPDGSVQHLNRREPTVFDVGLRFAAAKLPFLRRLFRRRMERYVCLDRGYDQPLQLTTMTGCFMLWRKSVLDELGGFDDSFFLYFEDTDLSKRASLKHKLMFLPEVSCTHDWGKGQYGSLRGFRQYLKSMARYFRKWGWKLW